MKVGFKKRDAKMSDPERLKQEDNDNELDTLLRENMLSDDFLRNTTVDQESVVTFLEGMMQAMGSSMPGSKPKQDSAASRSGTDEKRYHSKAVGTIMNKLQRAGKYPETAVQLQNDSEIIDWLGRCSCKQKQYFEELSCARELTAFFAGYRCYELAIKAAAKALSITSLHRRDDLETLAEFNWVLAELHAAGDHMDESLLYLRQCLNCVEPDASEDHPTYKELLLQLQNTQKRNHILSQS